MVKRINGILNPEISPLVIDLKPPLSIFSRGFKIEKLPKSGVDRKADAVFQYIVDDIRAAKRTVGTKMDNKIR